MHFNHIKVLNLKGSIVKDTNNILLSTEVFLLTPWDLHWYLIKNLR